MLFRKTIAIIALIITTLACTLSSSPTGTDSGAALTMAAQTISAVQTGSVTQGAATVAPGVTPSATSTQPAAPATATSKPCNLAHFVQDVTVPDNTAFKVNELFTKTWRLENVGSCAWTSGYQVVFESGDQMGGPASFQLTNGTVAPGQTIDVSVNLKAPGTPGTYKGNWKLREPGGVIFGLSTGPFWVQIQAKSQAAVLPDWPIVKSGNSGPEVRALQHLLKQAGHDLTADGIFGPITTNQVKAFQGANGLVVDGIVGPKTWTALIVQVQQGAHGQAVRAVQVLLSEKYNYAVTVDGDFGPITNNAVRDFQDENGLAVDGIVGPQTWRMLIGQ